MKNCTIPGIVIENSGSSMVIMTATTTHYLSGWGYREIGELVWIKYDYRGSICGFVRTSELER